MIQPHANIKNEKKKQDQQLQQKYDIKPPRYFHIPQ